MTNCYGYCQRSDFPLVKLAKTRRYWPYRNIKSCAKCEYVTITDLIICPCCSNKFRIRPRTQEKNSLFLQNVVRY